MTTEIVLFENFFFKGRKKRKKGEKRLEKQVFTSIHQTCRNQQLVFMGGRDSQRGEKYVCIRDD